MEMCYEGTLVMPSSYAVMDEEEMTYIEGGNAKTFAKNLIGLWGATRFARWAWRDSGIKLSQIKAAAQCTYWCAVAKFGSGIVKVAVFLSRALAAVLAVGTVAAVAYLWNKRVFY